MNTKATLKHSESHSSLLRWIDIAWGLKRGLLTHSEVVALAMHRVNERSNEEEFRLAGLDPSDDRVVEGSLEKLVAIEEKQGDDSASRWAFTLLLSRFEAAQTPEELLKCVDDIYCDLEHPEEISAFVSWLPPSDGYDPATHTFAENQRRLVNLLYDYLARNAAVYGVQPPKHRPLNQTERAWLPRLSPNDTAEGE